MATGNYSLLVTEADGNVITASNRNSEHQNHINNMTFAGIAGYHADSTEIRAQASPGTYSSPTTADPSSGETELEYLRYVIGRLIGGTNESWLDVPATNLSVLASPNDLSIGLEFDSALGAVASTTDAFAKLINQGAIINALSYNTADVAIADFDSTNVKFGTYSYACGAGNLLAFPGTASNPVKGSLSAWNKGLSANELIAYNPQLGIEFGMNGSSQLYGKITEKTASAEDTKNSTTITGDDVANYVTASASAFKNAIFSWDLNGSSTDALKLYWGGTEDSSVAVSSDDIDINYGDGGVWFFGCKRNDPTWDHFYAANGLPSAHSDAWTKTGTFTENASTGVLSMSSAAGSGARTYSKTNNVDLTNFTMEIKCRVNDVTRKAVDEDRLVLVATDTAIDRGVGLSFTENSVLISSTSSGSTFGGNLGREYLLDTSKWHTYRVTTASNGSDIDITLYIDGVSTGSFTNTQVDTTATGIVFGCQDTGSVTFDWDIEYIAYHDAAAAAPIAVTSGGNLDSIGVINSVITDSTATLLQSSKVSKVFNVVPTYGPYLGFTEGRNRAGNDNFTDTSAVYAAVPSAVRYFLPGDGVTEFAVNYQISALFNPGEQMRVAIDLNGDVAGEGDAFEGAYGYHEADAGNTALQTATLTAKRVFVLPVGLNTIRAEYLTGDTIGIQEETELMTRTISKMGRLP